MSENGTRSLELNLNPVPADFVSRAIYRYATHPSRNRFTYDILLSSQFLLVLRLLLSSKISCPHLKANTTTYQILDIKTFFSFPKK